MSSTTQPKRTGPDFYVTPDWCTQLLLAQLPALASAILEPSAGDGAILRLLSEKYRRSELHAVEIRSEEGPGLIEIGEKHGGHVEFSVGHDFLTWHPPARYDLIVTNPPFSLAQEFVERSIRLLAPGGTAWFLLRLAFWESAKRQPLLRRHAPDTLVLPRRPSFTGGATDSCAYAWFGFPQEERDRAEIRVLEVA